MTMTMEPNTAPRGLDLPTELSAALEKNSAARAAFEAMPPSHRKEYASYVAEGKKAETRERRAAKTMEMLVEGKKLKA